MKMGQTPENTLLTISLSLYFKNEPGVREGKLDWIRRMGEINVLLQVTRSKSPTGDSRK